MYHGATAGQLLELMKDADQAYRRAVVWPEAARRGVLSHDLQRLEARRHAPSLHRTAVLWWWLSGWLVSVRMRARGLS